MELQSSGNPGRYRLLPDGTTVGAPSAVSRSSRTAGRRQVALADANSPPATERHFPDHTTAIRAAIEAEATSRVHQRCRSLTGSGRCP